MKSLGSSLVERVMGMSEVGIGRGERGRGRDRRGKVGEMFRSRLEWSATDLQRS